MKYFPNSAFLATDILDSEQLNKELQAGIQAFNQLDRENFNHNGIGSTQLAAACCNDYDLDFETGSSVTYTKSDVSRGWFVLPTTQMTITVEEGMLRGGFSGSVTRYPDGLGEYIPWKMGLFLDGKLVAETDLIFHICYGVHLQFATPLVAGTYTLQAAFKARVLPATTGGSTANDCFTLHEWQLWYRNAKR